ncbi:MAG: hypothetical protein KGH67_02015 [Candidatus Micrarchaeota archaeon]|nr:hypothetical protein [Candidatus Micrarchaeota archaeon]MDE1859280.1 hypothetical protein [Candidatus Micrarchaeota archaeon]
MVSKIILLTMAIVIVGLLAGVFFLGNGAATSHTASQSSVSATSGVTATNSNATLFASSPYAQYAYLISNDTLSQQAHAALAGFNLSNTKLANGTRKITIALQGTSQNQMLMLRPGYKLYIIETTFGDDGYGFDSSLGDDGFVLVNNTGYII